MTDTKSVKMALVPATGDTQYASSVVTAFIKELCYKRIVLKSDQEPSILKLRERIADEINSEIIPDNSPVGDHQATGDIENTFDRGSA